MQIHNHKVKLKYLTTTIYMLFLFTLNLQVIIHNIKI